MVKTIDAAMTTLIGSTLSTLALCMKMTRPDGTSAFFTAHDADLVVGVDTYESQLGFDGSAFDAKSGLQVDNHDVDIFIDTNQVSEQDVYARRWDYSTVDIFYIDWTNPAGTPFYIMKGWRAGEFTISDLGARVEARGKSDLLKQKILDLYSADCRVDLGSAACGVDLDNSQGDFQHTGTVTAIDTGSPMSIFYDATISEVENRYRFGKLTWLSPSSASSPSATGLNEGLSMEVKTYDPITKQVTLFEAMPFEIQDGDPYIMKYGCEKSLAVCGQVFGNVVNFRGFPYIPGIDKALQVVVGRRTIISGGGGKK